VNDYYYLYLIFIDCLIVLIFKHFYFDYEDKYFSKHVNEIIDNQWIWMLILCCHVKFCFLTIKEEFIDLNYLA